jgi:hypothetical protein
MEIQKTQQKKTKEKGKKHEERKGVVVEEGRQTRKERRKWRR